MQTQPPDAGTGEEAGLGREVGAPAGSSSLGYFKGRLTLTKTGMGSRVGNCQFIVDICLCLERQRPSWMHVLN